MRECTDEEICMVGKYLGYPDCCIAEFLNILIVGGIAPRKLEGTGYVPCETCDKLLESELIERINSKRICKTRFPLASFRQAVRDLKL